MKILLVIPAYNEEKSIVSVVEDAKKHGYDYIVINDGSTDHTIDICKGMKNSITAITSRCRMLFRQMVIFWMMNGVHFSRKITF